MRNTRRIKLSFIILFALLFTLCSGAQFVNQYKTSPTPTLFVHGYRGGPESMGNIIDHLEARGAGHQVMTITVTPAGKIKARGALTDSRNPLINVVFQNNIAGESMYTKWLLKVMAYLHNDYSVQKINLVGHSMGAYAVIASAMGNAHVKVNRLVAIAGPYDGIMHWDDAPHELTLDANGKPSRIRPEYRKLLDKRRHFKANAVLNIYGDVADGSNSDTVVTVASALSLRYILRNFHGTYAEHKMIGSHAQHSLLHINNFMVNEAVATFIWGQYPNPAGASAIQ